MKYSIKTKMFLILMVTTLCSFLLLLLGFNFLINSHIQKESSSDLNKAASVATAFGKTPSWRIDLGLSNLPSILQEPLANPLYDSNNTFDFSAPGAATPPTDFIINYLEQSLKLFEHSASNINFLLLASKDNELLYPLLTPSSSIRHKDLEILSLKECASQQEISTPTRVTLNKTNYYMVEAPVGDQIKAIFYTNVQPLDNLAKDINITLVILLILSAIITVTATMGLSNGMILSIQKLCNFANDIGAGNLQQQKLHLKEKELAVLEQDMNEMAQRLSAYDAEQKTFFQNVSHELRTPLMSIQGYAEGITSHVFEGEQAEAAAEIILSESDRLTDMVDNLLCLSRMDSQEKKEPQERFDCAEILRDVLEQATVLAGDKKVTLQQQGDECFILGNREEFQKAMSNIITNSLRYATSQITVHCDGEKRSICIADDGPGIAPQDLPHIFKRFYKGEDGCSGLGLAIAQTAIQNMGGAIAAENHHGAVFTISFANNPYLPKRKS